METKTELKTRGAKTIILSRSVLRRTFSLDSYFACVGSHCTFKNSETLLFKATASQTQTAYHQCESFTLKVEEKRHIGAARSLTVVKQIKYSLCYPHCSTDSRKPVILHMPADETWTGSTDWMTKVKTNYFLFLCFFEGLFCFNQIRVLRGKEFAKIVRRDWPREKCNRCTTSKINVELGKPTC